MSNFLYALLLVIAFLLGWGIRSVIFKPSKQKIVETRELIIEQFMDEGFVETERTKGDYDLNISPQGTENIQKILERLI